MGKGEIEIFDFSGLNAKKMQDVMSGLPPIQPIIEKAFKKFREKENEFFVKVLTDYLGRVPTTEDAKLCTLILHVSNQNKMLLEYNGVVLGMFEAIREWPKLNNGEWSVKMDFKFSPGVTSFE